ncbi:MAG: TonB-dependent receptor, partial [Gammaproteobacteria bacterium]|nr:TonB-dependent receptor [Gammaproteobacteria bacterium]
MILSQTHKWLLITSCLLATFVNVLWAQSTDVTEPGEEEVVVYNASFFQRYSPNTALDMIKQVPGFILDDGSALRGLGASAGNVLINDRRPSAKQDLPSLILSRIPASQVERIELIRGQVRDIDLQGEPVLANIILVNNSEAAISWEALWRHNLDISDTFEGAMSISDRWHDIDYNAGIRFRNYTRGDFTFEQEFDDSQDLVEIRRDNAFFEGYRSSANLNAETFLGETLVKFNTTLSSDFREGDRNIRRTPQPPGNRFRDELLFEDFERRNFEIGTEFERNLTSNLQSNAILLFILTDLDTFSTLQRTDFFGNQTLFRENDTGELSKETIGRIELDWVGINNHTIQFNSEVALNILNGTLFQSDDVGAGPVVINIPGANSRVEELRGDFLVKDTWTINKFELDYGLGMEISEISQSGDAEQKRSFTFIKPQAIVTYTSDQGNQTRLSLIRDVAQLNFSDFVTNAEFEDDDIALGNPDLKPDTTWIAQLLHERRFGEEAVFKISVFHHWISDVIDLIPITDTFEATGNIGNGRRWGGEVETSIPLEWLGLTGARID